MRRSAIPVSLLAASTLGCAAFTPPLTSPAEGGDPWTELTSRHYVLRTDLPPEEAREALAEFEGVYNLFVDVAFPTDESRAAHIGIVVFRRESDYRVLGRKGSSAYFDSWLPNDAEPEPTAVLHGGLVNETRLTFQHELTHHFMRQSLSHLPVWLNEGMADFYSTLRVDGGKVQVGTPLPTRGFTRLARWINRPNGSFTQTFIPVPAVPPAQTIADAGPEQFYAATYSTRSEPTMDEARTQTSFYGGAWALVHMLMVGPDAYRARFVRFVDALAHGKRTAVAWAKCFGDVAPDEMEKDFRAYLQRREYPILVKPYAARPAEPPRTERTMSDAEVHLLFARLDDWGDASGGRPRRHLDAALAADPGSPEVHFWRARYFEKRKELDAAAAEISAALATKADEPRYLLVQLQIAQARSARAGELRVLSDRLAKVAGSATELDAVARARARLRSADEGLPFAERAIQSGPACWRCFDTYALLLSEKGQFDEAASAEERAIERMPEYVRDAGPARRLRAYRKEAARASTAPTETKPAEAR